MRVGRFAVMLVTAALAGRATPSRAATDSVLVRVGGDLSARAGQYINVPITVDLRSNPTRLLGGYRGRLSFNPAILQYIALDTGTFAAPQVNTVHAVDSGQVRMTALQPSGAGGIVTIFVARFYVLKDSAQSPVTVSFDEMTASATSGTPFEILLPLVRIVNGTFCRSRGLWGDVDGDGKSDSRDALEILTSVVGLPIDTTKITIALGDVDGDGRIDSRDALIILTYAVGLPVPGSRIMETAAGACGTGAASSLVIVPDSLELQVGQGVTVLVQGRDSSGRAVPAESLTWVSSNPTVAGYEPAAGVVRGRAAGFTTLTAQLGPGVQGTLKVSVLARRTTWYVDVERARNAPTQVGMQSLPMQFIGDALPLAHSGDTVRVASGIYEELVSSYLGPALTIIGDSVNRPVIDPRGAPTWATSNYAVDLEPHQGAITLANLDVRAGTVYLDAHDLTVRHVLIEGLSGTNDTWALYLNSENYTPGTAPPATGPMRVGSPVSLGNVLVDGVVVTADSTYSGIWVERADSVTIRNSTVSRSTPGQYCYGSAGSNSAIQVYAASVTLIQNNAITNARCLGIGAFDVPNSSAPLASDIGRATVSHNRVTAAAGPGIMAGSRVVALDHNVVMHSADYGVQIVSSYGCECTTGNTDSLTSVRDSVMGAAYAGIYTSYVGSVVIDTAVVDSVGAGYYGIYIADSKRALIRASVSRHAGYGIYAYDVDSVQAIQDTLHGNATGLYAYNYSNYYAGVPIDSVTIHRTVIDSSRYGIDLYTASARIDSTVVSGDSIGLLLDYGYAGAPAGAMVRWSRFQGNSIGVQMNGSTGASTTVTASNFIGNKVGAENVASPYDTLFAANNYWNDSAGPRCRAGVGIIGCSRYSVAGDSVVTLSVLFTPYLAAQSMAAPASPARPSAYATSWPAAPAAGPLGPRAAARPVPPPLGVVAGSTQRTRVPPWHRAGTSGGSSLPN